ncbi:MAG: methionine--tRNA ligase [Deltaproteobacteria bacterium]|nr:methionine--tRNA ligase [Deltaproteobacteria bacterium]
MSTRTLVTSGLPYANGSIHLGHLVEYLQTDIFVRALKLSGKDVLYCCGDDTHGTPIEVSAQKRGIKPEQLVAETEKEHVEDFKKFDVGFDGFYGTNHPVNEKYAIEIYDALKKKGWIERRQLEQLYCETDKRFLPDRFVRGTCPKCGTADQYGDVCESCGTTYQPTELKGPKCILCGTAPVLKSSEHAFFVLEKARKPLVEWLDTPGRVQPEMRNFVETWLKDGLRDWCITRDGPYFGFHVPDMPGKYFYVWLDAPIGYIGSTHRTAERLGKNVEDYWRGPAGETEIVHVIGKDIVYFHALFWPALLSAAGFTLPSKLHVHGMLRVNGEKMSKTRGTFINAKVFAAHLDPQYLRFYYATKLSAKVEDIDLSFEDFVNRINAELVNKIVNLYSRVVPFLGKLDKRLGNDARKDSPEAREVVRLLTEAQKGFTSIDHAHAMQQVLAIADIGNKYFQDNKPWEKMKADPEGARAVCTFVINVCKAVTIGIKPVLPKLAAETEKMLGIGPVDFRSPLFDLTDRSIGEPQRLIERIDMEPLNKIVEASATAAPAAPPAAAPIDPVKPEITYDQFSVVDLRAGKIKSAERVPKSEKLLKLMVDVGEPEPRQVIAGIGLAYQPEQLVGKTVVCCVNLKPAKLMGHESKAMILAAGPGGKDLVVTELPAATPAGAAVK